MASEQKDISAGDDAEKIATMLFTAPDGRIGDLLSLYLRGTGRLLDMDWNFVVTRIRQIMSENGS